jgi:hypothetical protein
MKFIPFGDSHSYFWGKQKNYPGQSLDDDVPFMAWLGPAKAYGLFNSTENNTLEKFEKIKPFLSQRNLIPVACFGEIDIRINCTKNYLFTGSEAIVENLADNYLQVIASVNKESVVIWGPPPSAPDDGMFNSDLPAFGNNKTRNYLTHVFNRRVVQNIKKYPNLIFVSSFYDLVNEDLITKKNSLHDGCHMMVELQPVAKQAIFNALGNKSQVALNLEKFMKISRHKRIFVKTTKIKKNPYLNYYKNKKSNSNLIEYFAYSPDMEINAEILEADLTKL